MGWYDTFEDSIKKTKGYLLTGVSLSGRVMYAAGQTYFNMKSANDYLKIGNTGIGKATEITAVIGTMISTLIGKAPAAWKQFGPKPPQTEQVIQAEPPLGWGSWLFKKTVEGSGIFYGFTNSIAGYFGTRSLCGDLMGKGLGWDITAEATSIYVGGTSILSYYAYDYKLIQENAESMARALNAGIFRLNKAMAYTAGVGAAIIPPYLGQAYFWAKPSIMALPYAQKILGDTGINILTGITCATTLFTIIGWLPSVYNHLNKKAKETEENTNAQPKTAWSTALSILAYTSGVIDSLGGNGLGPFYSIIFALEQLLGINPYGWVILYAVICGINTTGMNMLFSVIPGLNDALELLHEHTSKNKTDEEAELPVANATDYGTIRKEEVFTEQNQQSGLTFFKIPHSAPVDIPKPKNLDEVRVEFS